MEDSQGTAVKIVRSAVLAGTVLFAFHIGLAADMLDTGALGAGSSSAVSSPAEANSVSPASAAFNVPGDISAGRLFQHPPYRWSSVRDEFFSFTSAEGIGTRERDIFFPAGSAASEIQKNLDRHFGDGRLIFKLDEASSVLKPGGRAAGSLLDVTGKTVVSHAGFSFSDAVHPEAVPGDFEAYKISAALTESLHSQLAAFTNPVVSFHFGIALNGDSSDGGIPLVQDHYVFRAEKPGVQHLYLERISKKESGPVSEKWVYPVYSGEFEEEFSGGAIRVKPGEFFVLPELKRAASSGPETQEYRWLTAEEILAWSKAETESVRDRIERILAEVRLPGSLNGENLAESDEPIEEAYGAVRIELERLYTAMVSLGFIIRGGPVPQHARELEKWASSEIHHLYRRAMELPVLMRQGENDTVITVPMSGLMKQFEAEIKDMHGSKYEMNSETVRFRGLGPEILGELHPEEDFFDFQIFNRESRTGGGPSLRDLRRVILGLINRSGKLILVNGEISPTLFALAVHGVDAALQRKILELYKEEAAKNKKKTENIEITLQEIRVVKSTRDWPVTGLELEAVYQVKGKKAHTASARAMRSPEGYDVEILSIGAPFTDEFLEQIDAYLLHYLPGRGEARDVTPIYNEQGGFHGVSFHFRNRSYVAELLRGGEDVLGIRIFGDYSGDGVLNAADSETGAKIAESSMIPQPFFFVSLEQEGGHWFGEVLSSGNDLAVLWAMEGERNFKQLFALENDLTGDGKLSKEDLAAALGFIEEAAGLYDFLLKHDGGDYNGDGNVTEEDAVYIAEFYETALKAPMLLTGAQKQIFDIDGNGMAGAGDAQILVRKAREEAERRVLAAHLRETYKEALDILESILAITPFPDQNFDGILDPGDGLMLSHNLTRLTELLRRLDSLRSQTESLIEEHPEARTSVQETLHMIEEYLSTGAIAQAKVSNSLQETSYQHSAFSAQ